MSHVSYFSTDTLTKRIVMGSYKAMDEEEEEELAEEDSKMPPESLLV